MPRSSRGGDWTGHTEKGNNRAPRSRDRPGAPGNLTDDGLYLFKYDAWNRLVKATRRLDALTLVATVAYDALHRRVSKAVTHCGLETTPGDGGNTTVDFFYDNQWRVVETQNGAKQTTRQFVYGTQYVDEPILMDVNGDPSIGNNVDPDVTATGEGGESPADTRYFYHQDRNWNVTALTAYEPGGGGDTGAIVERYSYTPYGEFVAYAGSDASGNDLARPRGTSSVGAMFAHQGLQYDAEIGRYQNRFRTYVPGLQRFGERDPDGMPQTFGYASYFLDLGVTAQMDSAVQFSADSVSQEIIPRLDEPIASRQTIETTQPYISLLSQPLVQHDHLGLGSWTACENNPTASPALYNST